MPVSARQQLSHILEEVAMQLSVLFYSGIQDALAKALNS